MNKQKVFNLVDGLLDGFFHGRNLINACDKFAYHPSFINGSEWKISNSIFVFHESNYVNGSYKSIILSKKKTLP